MTGSIIITKVLKNLNITCRITQGEKNRYEPETKTIYLNPNVYKLQTTAGLAISLHEFGHLLQDVEGYWPFRMSRHVKLHVLNVWLEWDATRRTKKILKEYLTPSEFKYCRIILNKLFLTHLIPAVMLWMLTISCFYILYSKVLFR
jgi:Zn-dependent membrane protease YugP